MHEMGIVAGVMDSVEAAARDAGADRVLKISLSVGVMTEAIEDALRFAFEALSEGTMMEGAEFEINMIEPVSICLECGKEYSHDRFHMLCPECGSAFTELLQGKELRIDSIEVDIPDEDDAAGDADASAQSGQAQMAAAAAQSA